MLPCMRTTIRLDEQLLIEAKKQAAETGRTLTQVIHDALREAFARRRTSKPRAPVRFSTVGGQGLQPGVDLDDTAALLDLMERHDDAR